jgi:hypothetical protein
VYKNHFPVLDYFLKSFDLTFGFSFLKVEAGDLMIDKDSIEKLGYELDTIIANRKEKAMTGLDIPAGWYQNIKGSLYHYDGVVWDEVPDWDIKQLEYLG